MSASATGSPDDAISAPSLPRTASRAARSFALAALASASAAASGVLKDCCATDGVATAKLPHSQPSAASTSKPRAQETDDIVFIARTRFGSSHQPDPDGRATELVRLN